MWQRKQTIFLIIVGVCMMGSIFFPIWHSMDNNMEMVLFPLHYSVVSEMGLSERLYFPYCIIALLAAASATLAFFEIGRFENRLLQIKLGALNSLFMAGTIGIAVYFTITFIKTYQVAGKYGLALVLTTVAMVSNMVANWFIRKDEKMMRESNRLR